MPATGMGILCLAIGLVPGPSGIWIGQDGHDYVGPSSEVKPSDVQDIHLVLDGLPPARVVVQAVITGLGGDEWQYQGKWGPWAAFMRRAEGSRRADLFLEPSRVETGRPITVKLRYDDGTASELTLRGRRAQPNLRMPGATLALTWLGQEPFDQAGVGPGVGPDGLRDLHLALRGLSSGFDLTSALIDTPGGERWRFGLNPQGDSNAELLRDPRDRSKADLYIQPARDLAGQTLRVTITYAHGKTDTATLPARSTDPALAMPPVTLPRPIAHAISARWLGQDASHEAAPGDVHVRLTGLAPGWTIAAADLSDSVQGYWAYRGTRGDSTALPPAYTEQPLKIRPGNDPTQLELHFAPVRDETNTAMTLRLVLADGSLAVVRFPGGACDLRLRVPETAGSTIEAQPGDDLATLVNRHRTVKLAPGTYRLTHPLVLSEPIALLGTRGATLLFEQGSDQPPWPAAIIVHRSHTTLDGFAVRFAGPLRWKTDVPWGPAIVGVTETLDNTHPDPRIGLTFTNLDLEAPPAANPEGWEPAPRSFRLVNSRGGRVANNRLKGGEIELCEGPWEIVDNEYQGAAPGTVCPCVIAAHNCFDLVVRGNRARPVGPSGKTWRFIVLTGSGAGDRVEENIVTAIGPRDDDTIPPANSPEVVLTEAYHLHFEGKPAAISADGTILSLGQGGPLGYPPRPGSVVAVLAGSQPGQWRRIALVLDRVTFLLDRPLPPGTERIAIATGFVNETFARNTIDSRGGAKAANLILAGNHFGTRVLGNHLLGAGDAFQITAYPTESPGIWGWSHAPFLGGLISGNIIEDSERGGTLGVLHSEHTKSNRGRTYLTATLEENTIKWSAPFLLRRRPVHPQRGTAVLPPALTIGYPSALDPGELVVATRHNRLDAPAGTSSAVTVRVHSAILNGKPTVNRAFTLTPVTPVDPAASTAADPTATNRR